MPSEETSKLIYLTDKKKIRWLEENTTPLLNAIPFDLSPTNELYSKIIDLSRWEFRFGLGVTFTQRTLKNKLSQLLGAKWAYCVNYDYQNAVWAFEYGKRNIGILIYFSKKGTSFQVESKITPNELLEIIDVIHDKLFKSPLQSDKKLKSNIDPKKDIDKKDSKVSSTPETKKRRGRPPKNI
jgi:hypothetical protein